MKNKDAMKLNEGHIIDWSAIIDWYATNARNLPWRISRNPYAIWVSEIMLQQTTVATVIPYFERFMKKWPTVHALAATSLEDLLHAWQGLGYYRRARWLHLAAQVISQQGWPTTVEGLKALQGVGSYTSRAIASIAFDVSTLPIDGNIARIMARVLGWHGNKNTLLKKLEQHDWGNIPQPGVVAQALMDLGQAICKPRHPLCEKCPFQAECRAPASQPFDDVATPPRRLYAQALCTSDDQGDLVCEEAHVSAPSSELLKGLWTPLMTPWREEPYDKNWFYSSSDTHIFCGTLTHVFSHIRLKVDVFRTPSYNAHTGLPHKPFSKLARKIIQCASNYDS